MARQKNIEIQEGAEFQYYENLSNKKKTYLCSDIFCLFLGLKLLLFQENNKVDVYTD